MNSTQEGRWAGIGNFRGQRGKQEAWQRWAPVVGGSVLAVLGVSRRSAAGWALAAAGGALAYSGLRAGRNDGQQTQRNPELATSILVNATRQEAFNLWRKLEDAPRYMNFIDSVEQLDHQKSRWTASGPLGLKLQWTSEITGEQEGEYIAWRSLPGSDLDVQGRVEFRQAQADRGTEVHSSVQYRLANRALRNAASGFVGRQARFFMRQDLRRFKALLETGEVPTTHGQTHGPRSSFDMAAKAINPNRPQRRQAQATGRVEAFRRVS